MLFAELIFWLHITIIGFNVFGLVVVPLGAWRGWSFVRIFWWRALHLLMLIAVAVQAALGRACFLTIWEDELMTRSGESTTHTPLIQGWLSELIFWPLPLWVFAALYIAIFIYAVALWRLVPPRSWAKLAFPPDKAA
jgi:Protein of Unknown function (DUF2784)